MVQECEPIAHTEDLSLMQINMNQSNAYKFTNEEFKTIAIQPEPYQTKFTLRRMFTLPSFSVYVQQEYQHFITILKNNSEET